MNSSAKNLLLEKARSLLLDAVGCMSCPIAPQLSEKLEKFLENEAPVKAIVFDYYKNFIPYFANVFSSLFTFISVIFFTSKMAYDSEIIAILSTGISFRRFLFPYLMSATVIAILSFLLGAFIFLCGI